MALVCLLAFGAAGCVHTAGVGPAWVAPEEASVSTAALPTFAPGTYFRLEEEHGRWWFVTPEGAPFLSIGVNHLSWRSNTDRKTGRSPYNEAVVEKYGTEELWAKATCENLTGWNFTTIGAWSTDLVTPYLPRTPILNLGDSYWQAAWKEGRIPDFFDPAFREQVDAQAAQIEAKVGDPMIVGYFLDNELPWAPDHRNAPELFQGYLDMEAGSYGKEAFVAFMQERHDTVEAFNRVWGPRLASWADLAGMDALKVRNRGQARADREAFTLHVARRYFSVTAGAIRSRDPGRLVLGCRFMPYTVPKAVVEACGEYCDVISVNYYEQLPAGRLFFWWKKATVDRMPQGVDLAPYYEVGKKPVMVTEFTSRLKKKGHNDWPPAYAIQPVVKTEEKRIDRYARQVMSWYPEPWFVGSHWFEYADQPEGGRGDGENSIFGLVQLDDEPYDVFVKGVADINRAATAAHAASGRDSRR